MRPNLGRILLFMPVVNPQKPNRPNLGHILLPFGAKFDEATQKIFLS